MKKIAIYLVLIAIFITSSWSLFNPEFFFIHDYTHGARIVEMHKALVDGHFPVRWTSDFGFGYGMPLFEFYAPLPYFVGAIFYSLGFSIVGSIKILFFISTLVVLIGGYKLGKILFGRSGGLIVSATLTLASYRAVNLFVRGAISEVWGIMVLPFILYGIIKIIKKEKHGWIVLLISLVTLLLSHNLTTLIFLPLSVLFGAGYLIIYLKGTDLINTNQTGKLNKNSKITNSKLVYFYKQTLALASIYLLSIIISSFYLLPVLMEKGYTRVEDAILGGYFDYKLHFLYIRQFFENNWQYGGSQWGPDDGLSFYFGTGQLFALALLVFLVFKSIYSSIAYNNIPIKELNLNKSKKLKSNLKLKNIYFIIKNISETIFSKNYLLLVLTTILFLIPLFMSLGHSSNIWKSLSFFEFIQFPWRWLSASIVFLAMLSGFVTVFLKSRLSRYFYTFIIITLTIVSSWYYFQPESYLKNSNDLYYTDEAKIRTQMSSILPDYIPVQMQGINLDPVAPLDTILFCEIEENCGFKFTNLVDKTHQKLVNINLDYKEKIEFAVADFPGWTVEVDGVVREHQVSEFGTIMIELEPGDHKVGLIFKNSKIRSIADMISLFGLLLFTTIFFWYYGNLENKLTKK